MGELDLRKELKYAIKDSVAPGPPGLPGKDAEPLSEEAAGVLKNNVKKEIEADLMQLMAVMNIGKKHGKQVQALAALARGRLANFPGEVQERSPMDQLIDLFQEDLVED